MKTYTFAIPDAEAEALDANINCMRYAFPDMSDEDAVIAIVRMGSETILQRLKKMPRNHQP